MHFHKIFLQCSLCGNNDQSAFFMDHQHGSAICMKCGCECRGFQMMKPSYKDLETHNIRSPRKRHRISHYGHGLHQNHQQQWSTSKALATLSPPRRLTGTTAVMPSFRNNNRSAAIRSILEYLCQHFRVGSQSNVVDRAMALYERNVSIYETKYVAKKEIWAAACFSVEAGMRGTKLSYKEIASAFNDHHSDFPKVEPKRICKTAGYIKLHDGQIRGDEYESVSRRVEDTGNLAAVSRLASVFGMNFHQEKLAAKIVTFVDEEELISGLNPLSILSVSFFLALTLSANTDDLKQDVPAFVKRTLKQVGKSVHIAQNTIRKGVRDVQSDVLKMVTSQRQRGRLRVNKKILSIVETWEL